MDGALAVSNHQTCPDYHNSPMAELDLEPVIAKLCHPTRGLGWELERAFSAVEQYRRWLWLNAKYEAERLSPSKDVDQVWHMHILDTRKYAEDCKAMFGHFLHHNPYAGWESAEAEAAHQADFERTKKLYLEHFGEGFLGLEGLCMSGYCDRIVGSGNGETGPAKPIWRPTIADIGVAA